MTHQTQPLFLADVLHLCMPPGASALAVMRRLGPSVLVARMRQPDNDDGGMWPFNGLSPAAELAGLELQMRCWPLFRRGLGTACLLYTSPSPRD